MTIPTKFPEDLRHQIELLQAQLRETGDLVGALQTGQVDAFVMPGRSGERVYTLSGSDRLYHTLIETMSEGAVTLTADGRVLYGNRRLADRLKTPVETFVGSNLRRFVSPTDLPMFDALIRPEAGEERKGEIVLHAADGTPLPVYLSASPLDLDDVHGACVVVTDLTEQRRHQEIVAAEKLARLILDQAAEAIVVCNAEGQIIRAGRQAEQLCGFPPILESFDRVFSFEASVPFSLQIPLAGETVKGREVSFTRRDGRSFSLLASAGPLVGAEGEIVGCVVTLTDNTARKRAEQELLRSNRELEQFAYVASHDLKEPLRMVTQYTQMLQRRYAGQLDPDADEMIRYAVDGARRMSRLIEDLLAYSRITAAGQQLQRTDCERVLDEVIEDLRLAITEAGATISRDPLPVVLGDPSQVVQVMQNLLSNAVKFRDPARDCRVHVSARKSDGEWVFEIRDNGIGFEPQHAERIFQVFQRLHTRDEYEGSGIGLAICRKLVEQRGGRIWAESAPGQSTSFFFTIPA